MNRKHSGVKTLFFEEPQEINVPSSEALNLEYNMYNYTEDYFDNEEKAGRCLNGKNEKILQCQK